MGSKKIMTRIPNNALTAFYGNFLIDKDVFYDILNFMV